MTESEKGQNRENPYSEVLNGKNNRADARLIQGVLGAKAKRASPVPEIVVRKQRAPLSGARPKPVKRTPNKMRCK